MKRRWIYWLLVIAFIWLVVNHFHEFADFSHTLARGHLLWILVAVTLQILHYLISSTSYRTAFNTVGIDSRLRDLFPLLFSAIFLNVVAPTGGASGAALFVGHAARNGQSPTKATAGLLLQLIVSMMAFMTILTAGMVYLGIEHGLQLYQVGAALILVLMVALGSGFLVIAMRRPALLRSILAWIQGTVNRLYGRIKPTVLLSDEWVEDHATEFIEAAEAITTHPRSLIYTLGFLLFAHVINLAVLYTLFLAFSQTIQVGTLVAGYAVGILFLIVSITPQGIGVVEGVMPLVFNSMGVPNGVSALTVLAFRGLSFWLPLVVGFLLLRWSGVFRPRSLGLSR